MKWHIRCFVNECNILAIFRPQDNSFVGKERKYNTKYIYRIKLHIHSNIKFRLIRTICDYMLTSICFLITKAISWGKNTYPIWNYRSILLNNNVKNNNDIRLLINDIKLLKGSFLYQYFWKEKKKRRNIYYAILKLNRLKSRDMMRGRFWELLCGFRF